MAKERYFLVILPLLLAIWLVANLELGGRVLGGQEEEREGELLASRKQNYQRWFERLQEQTEVIETFAVKDLNAVPVKYWEEIGGPAAYIRLTGYEMTDAIVMYKKAHRHWGEAILYIVTGKGYTLIWEKRKFDERQRANWQANSLIGVPPGVWYHQHFNTGREPARYIAFRGARGLPGRTVDSRVMQIEHEDEFPLISEEYMKEIAREGIEFKMRDIFEK